MYRYTFIRLHISLIILYKIGVVNVALEDGYIVSKVLTSLLPYFGFSILDIMLLAVSDTCIKSCSA